MKNKYNHIFIDKVACLYYNTVGRVSTQILLGGYIVAKNMKTMDGNTAAAYTAYAFTEVAAIYPITPSSTMAEVVDEWSANDKRNIFGQRVDVAEMQSEAGAAGAVHGSLSAGALTTTFTASQGLLLMVPNMYKIAGELLPGVFHVSARAIASHALSIFGDHSDVMGVRQTGFAMIASNSVQEVADLGGIAHLASIKSRIPFLHFFDGFRTSHEIQKVETIDYEEYKRLLDWEALKEFKASSMNPERPFAKGTAQNPDIFFQAREAINKFYDATDDIVNDYMIEISKITNRDYKPFTYYGAEDATDIIIAMGSVCETIEETIDYLNARGSNVGLIKVHLYRPFSEKYFFNVCPKSVKRIAVLDRTKEPGAVGDPLYTDVLSMFYDKEDKPKIIAGRYGLGSKDTTPTQIKAVYDNLMQENPKNKFTIGIFDDVTNTSLPLGENINTIPDGTISCKFWGLGSDGTVGANKSAIKIIGNNTDMYAQGYFDYDSKKSGGITVSHLRFGTSPIKSTYLIAQADFVSCSMQSYVDQYDMVGDVKKGGTFLLNTIWDAEKLEKKLPAKMKKLIAENEINFYTINATKVAHDIGLGRKANMIMQAAFFNLSKVIDYADAEKYLKDQVLKSYGKKGEKVVQMNYDAIDNAVSSLCKIDVPEHWKNAEDNSVKAVKDEPEFIKNVLRPIVAQKGNTLPVSAFSGRENGVFPPGTSAFEKRCIAVSVPQWDMNKCIQCNQCSLVCPHAAIRPILVSEEELALAPSNFDVLKAKGKGIDQYKYRIQVSPMDCTGCASCVNTCIAKDKALTMEPVGTQFDQVENWEYAVKLPQKEVDNIYSVKNSQFLKPLLEFSGACEGCGETPYAKLITQLYGDRMYIANATGCSSIWGASAPSIPYTVNDKGCGPAWANSLFEDNAEYGYGMFLAVKKQRDTIKDKLEDLVGCLADEELKGIVKEYIEVMDEGEQSKVASAKMVDAFSSAVLSCEHCKEIVTYILDNQEHLIKKSVWIFGGDGWSYDIGYGGLDHVLASNEDVNVLVFDTEVYSNTGGQSSKATPTAAVAKFAAQGKKVKKKDLGMMATAYGYVYVAQVAMGADKNQVMKAVKEAEAYKGPSLIIAYAPCINHGIKAGMGCSMMQSKNAVDSGYWHLYRYNPDNKALGKNCFMLDSKEPSLSFQDFIKSESRYTSLAITFPDIAQELFDKTENDAKERYEKYRKMAEM